MLTPIDWAIAVLNFLLGLAFGINLQEIIDRLVTGIFILDTGILIFLVAHYLYVNPDIAQSLLNYTLEKIIYMMVSFVLGSVPGIIINAFAENLKLR